LAINKFSKIQPRSALAKTLSNLKKQKKTIVFTNGCFDILHAGHVKSFEMARSKGDVLVVALNTDASVRRLKGSKRPIVDEKNRARLLAGLACVDFVTFFGEDTPEELIKELRPDILVKGGDYKLEEIAGRQYVKKVVRVPLVKGISTTKIVEKIIKAYGSR
jgi:rfaE bifunctional protein nucleotidyltransferase chain/domain